MLTFNYSDKEEDQANTETLIAVDESIAHKFGNLQRAYNEGFAASSGVRGETAETSGRVLHPEKGDETSIDFPINTVEDENAGLADN